MDVVLRQLEAEADAIVPKKPTKLPLVYRSKPRFVQINTTPNSRVIPAERTESHHEESVENHSHRALQ